jgi:glycosyltransferase involved in cell wall biosynthesis
MSTSRSLWKRLLSVHAQTPFDIVQAASYNSTNLYAKSAIPSIVRISSFEPLWRKAYDKPFTAAQILYEFLEARAIKKATAVYCPSKRIADHVSSHLKIPVSVIESPFIPDVREPDNTIVSQRLRDKTYLLFFGTIGLLKGCKTIADILEPLLMRHQSLFFVFAGTMENYRGRPMADCIIEHAGRAKDRVVILPPLKHNALYPVIGHAQAVILPSRVDNLPNTCLEAMNLGKIVVGTRGTSFEQLIDHEVSGFLSTPDDPDSLHATIEKVLSLPESRRNEISQKAKLRMEKCSPAVLTPVLVAFYRKSITEHTRLRSGGENR